jgi:hypothetical protein
LQFWQQFCLQQPGRFDTGFPAHHPTDETRIHKLKEWMPQAKRVWLGSRQSVTSQFGFG